MPNTNSFLVVELLIIIFPLLFVLFGYGAIMQRQNIQFQKKVGVLYIIAAISPLALLLQTQVSWSHIAILTVPIGLLLGLFLASINKMIAEILHFILLVMILAWQFHPYWLG